MTLGWLFAVFLIGLGGVSADTTIPKPLQLIVDMQHAMASLNYQGTLAILKNAQLDTMKYVHATEKGVEQERLLSLNSPLREVVRDRDKVSCLFKTTQQVVVDHKPTGHSFLMDLTVDPAKLEKTYLFETEADAEVALQPAYVVILKPQDQYRYMRKFWIAKQTRLPLKIEVLDFTGETLEQVIFTDLQVVSPSHKVTLDLTNKKVHHIHEFQNLELDKLPIELKNLPAGFEKRQYTRTHLHPSNKSVEQILVSDGLSSVSVYLEHNPPNFHAGLQRSGAVNSLGRVYGDTSVTVMGDVPASAVSLIADGVFFSGTKE